MVLFREPEDLELDFKRSERKIGLIRKVLKTVSVYVFLKFIYIFFLLQLTKINLREKKLNALVLLNKLKKPCCKSFLNGALEKRF